MLDREQVFYCNGEPDSDATGYFSYKNGHTFTRTDLNETTAVCCSQHPDSPVFRVKPGPTQQVFPSSPVF